MKVWSSPESSLLAWAPVREQSRLFAQATPVGGNGPAELTLKKFNFLTLTPGVETVAKINAASPFTALDWAVRQPLDLGYIVAGHQNGNISIFDPKLESPKQIGLIKNQSQITSLSINLNQTAAVLATSADNSVNVWDLSNIANGKNISVNLNRNNTGDITSSCWHSNKNCYSILAACDSTGLSTIWDIRANQATHSFADTQLKLPLSDIIFSPSNMAQLATASSDARNSVVLIWDIRQLGTPLKRLHGHSGGISSLEWPGADDRIILSAGRDGKVISWDVESAEPLASVFESGAQFTDVKWSPFIHGSVLASSATSTHLFSFADPSMGTQNVLKQPKFQYCKSGVEVSFDGLILQYTNGPESNKISSFLHQEPITEIDDFLEFVDSLERKDMKSYVANKITASANNATENQIWNLIQESMSPDTFKDKILQQLGIKNENLVQQIKATEAPKPVEKPKPAKKVEVKAPQTSLFGDAPQDNGLFSGSASTEDLFGAPAQGGLFGMPEKKQEESEASLFTAGDIFTPFSVLPKEDEDKIGRVIAQAFISGDLKGAVDCAFAAERYADALVIASTSNDKALFEETRQRYLKTMANPLSRIISHILSDNLANIVRIAVVQDWREIFATICSFAEANFTELCDQLGNRIVADLNDYDSALVIFVAARNYEMVQRCLFKIYEKVSPADANSAATVLAVLEKLCAMAGDAAPSVIAPLAQSFLQHIVQSGHKDMAVRFLSALPKNKVLADLKSAILGEPAVQQSQPQRQTVTPVQQRQNLFMPQPSTPSTTIPAPQAPPPAQQPQVQAPPPQQTQTPSFFVPQPAAKPPTFASPMPAPAASPAAPSINRPTSIYYPTPAATAAPPRPATIPHEPSAVPPPNSNDPRQLGRPMSYVPPPPPTAAQVMSREQPAVEQPVSSPAIFTPQAAPAINSPVSAPVPMNAPTGIFTPAASPVPMMGVGQVSMPQVAAPPPTSKPEIKAPPSINLVAPRAPQPAVANYPSPMMAGQPPAAPPAAQPTIIAPPPTAAPRIAVPGQPQIAVAQPQPAPQPVVEKRSPEATIDELPDNVKNLGYGFMNFINIAEQRPDKKPQIKKYIQDAKAKLPLALGSLRDGDVPEELQAHLAEAFDAMGKGNLDEANAIRKEKMIQYMSKCRNIVLLMNYILNALS